MNNLYERRMPDILECIANLSSDEVFTPPKVVNDMLDLLPKEVWSNPDLKFLDPGSKTGIFLRECAKRLGKGKPNQDCYYGEGVSNGFHARSFILKQVQRLTCPFWIM